jgi:hypothetical protein
LKQLDGKKSKASKDDEGQILQFNKDATPRVIFGSGNDNGSFTVGMANDIELALRGKLRLDIANGCEATNTFNSNGDGTYSFPAGGCNGGSEGVWSFEWSINSDVGCDSFGADSDCTPLAAYDYHLQLDGDRSYNAFYGWTSGLFKGEFDPINVAPFDHALGTDSTLQGSGTTDGCEDSVGSWSCPSASDCNVVEQAGGCQPDYPLYFDAINELTVAQNSWKYRFYVPTTYYDFSKPGIYSIKLFAKCKNSDIILASTAITILAGSASNFPTTATDCTNGAWVQTAWDGLFYNEQECLNFVNDIFP